MTRYVAFLRAVNVGGHAVFKMDVLVRSLEKAGLFNVNSYRQSGNVVFDSHIANDEMIEGIILEQLKLLSGVRTDVFLFRFEKMRSLVADDPFKGHLMEGDRAFATLLSRGPDEVPDIPLPLQEGISLIDVIGDIALSVVRKDVGSGPVNDLLETRFGVTATTRNWSTVKGLIKRSGN